MLMKTYYMYFILFCYFDEFINIIFINSKFAFGSSCYDMISSSCSNLWINSHKYSFTFQLFFVVFESIQSSNIKSHSFAQSILYLFLWDEILSVHNVLRFKATLKSLVNLSRWHNVYLLDSKIFYQLNYRWIGICLKSIFNFKAFGSN